MKISYSTYIKIPVRRLIRFFFLLKRNQIVGPSRRRTDPKDLFQTFKPFNGSILRATSGQTLEIQAHQSLGQSLAVSTVSSGVLPMVMAGSYNPTDSLEWPE